MSATSLLLMVQMDLLQRYISRLVSLWVENKIMILHTTYFEDSAQMSYPVVESRLLDASQTVYMPLGQELDKNTMFATSTLIRELFGAKTLVMERIFYCESRNRQWNENGNILTSKTNDIGYAQISVDTWKKKADELGLNLYSTEGNLRMGKYILDHHGYEAWSCYKLLR